MKNSKKILYLLIFAFLLRLVFLFPQYSGDVKNHLVWGNAFLNNALGIYSRHFNGFNDINYPPLTIFFFALSNVFLNGINSFFNFLNQSFSFFPSFLVPLFKSENMAMGFLKLPGILCDIGIGYLIYKLAVFLKSPKPLLIAALYLLNPAVIYISSVWGQVESVTNFFLLYSLYLSLVPKKQNIKFLSLPVFCLAVLIKQTAFWFIPFYLLLWIKEINWQGIVKGFITAIAIFFGSYLSVGLYPVAAVKSYFATLSGSSTTVADAAWNVWYFLFPSLPSDSQKIGFISIRQLSIILLSLVLIFLIVRLIKKYTTGRLLSFLFIWSLAVFFLQTRVHERHLAPAIMFCLLTPGLFTRYLLDFLILSAYHMYNLYWSLRLPFI